MQKTTMVLICQSYSTRPPKFLQCHFCLLCTCLMLCSGTRQSQYPSNCWSGARCSKAFLETNLCLLAIICAIINLYLGLLAATPGLNAVLQTAQSCIYLLGIVFLNAKITFCRAQAGNQIVCLAQAVPSFGLGVQLALREGR